MKTLKELNEIISSIDIIGVKSLMTKQSKQWLLNISVKAGNNVERERERLGSFVIVWQEQLEKSIYYADCSSKEPRGVSIGGRTLDSIRRLVVVACNSLRIEKEGEREMYLSNYIRRGGIRSRRLSLLLLIPYI
jgi:hypothetical protein